MPTDKMNIQQWTNIKKYKNTVKTYLPDRHV